MRIGIIGAGHIGSTLAGHFASAGHEVVIANSRGPDTLTALVDELGKNTRAGTTEEAARFGEVVVEAIPFGRYRELPAAELAGKTVIDTSNYYAERDGHFAELDDGTTTSAELIQAHLAGAHVVKAFNAILWSHLRDYGHPGGGERRYGIPIAGDDDAAKRQVKDLIEEMGFDPVDAGPLRAGAKFQPGTQPYGADFLGPDLREHLG
jgi:predicted dinucleotide-binding enzyme